MKCSSLLRNEQLFPQSFLLKFFFINKFMIFENRFQSERIGKTFLNYNIDLISNGDLSKFSFDL